MSERVGTKGKVGTHRPELYVSVARVTTQHPDVPVTRGRTRYPDGLTERVSGVIWGRYRGRPVSGT